jgi:hypothetical protein
MAFIAAAKALVHDGRSRVDALLGLVSGDRNF